MSEVRNGDIWEGKDGSRREVTAVFFDAIHWVPAYEHDQPTRRADVHAWKRWSSHKVI